MAGSPSYWSSPNVSPKRNYKWVMSFGAAGDSIPSWIVKTASKPSFDIGEASHSFINHTFFFPGKLTWSSIEVTLVDPLYPDATYEMVSRIKKAGYAYPNEPDMQAQTAAGITFSKAASVGQLGEVVLRQLGPQGLHDGGQAIDQWTLHNSWIKSVNFGSLSYDNEDITNINLTLRYDWAVYNNPSKAGHDTLRVR